MVSKRDYRITLLGLFIFCFMLFNVVYTEKAYCLQKDKAGADIQVQSEDTNLFIDEPERKDPFVAGLMSWSWSGLGQFYTQDYAYGSLFLLVDFFQKGLFFYLLFHYSDKYTNDRNDIVTWEDMENQDKTIIISYIFSILFVKTYCVIDAVHSANKYNRDIYFPYWKSKNRSRFSFYMQSDGVNVAMSTPF